MRLTIDLPGEAPRTSEVLIGEMGLKDLPAAAEAALVNRTAYWIWDTNVWEQWRKPLRELGWPGAEGERLILFPASEANKRLSTLEVLARQLVQAGADRGSALIAVGGGVTGDVTGFLASTYMRGIPFFQIPTTLLAQVDSSIGGKTGVDLPEGKNLLGTFHQPRIVWMFPAFLKTLVAQEFRQGMAEVIKTAMIGDEVLWKYIESHTDALKRRDEEALVRVISACCIVKARVVESDETEAGRRRVLNLGHTVGHAIERLSDYRLRHGDAVAMGLIAATKLSVHLGEMPASDLQRLERLCWAWGLPVRIPGTYTPEAIVAALQTDKKRIGTRLHFILPVRIGEVVDREELDLAELQDVLASVSEQARP